MAASMPCGLCLLAIYFISALSSSSLSDLEVSPATPLLQLQSCFSFPAAAFVRCVEECLCLTLVQVENELGCVVHLSNKFLGLVPVYHTNTLISYSSSCLLLLLPGPPD